MKHRIFYFIKNFLQKYTIVSSTTVDAFVVFSLLNGKSVFSTASSHVEQSSCACQPWLWHNLEAGSYRIKSFVLSNHTSFKCDQEILVEEGEDGGNMRG